MRRATREALRARSAERCTSFAAWVSHVACGLARLQAMRVGTALCSVRPPRSTARSTAALTLPPPRATLLGTMKRRFRALKASIKPFALVTVATATQRALPFPVQKLIVDLLSDKLTLLQIPIKGLIEFFNGVPGAAEGVRGNLPLTRTRWNRLRRPRWRGCHLERPRSPREPRSEWPPGPHPFR